MKITLRQGKNGNKDPVLHIGITDHSNYVEDRLVCDTVEEALEKIKAWLYRRVNDN